MPTSTTSIYVPPVPCPAEYALGPDHPCLEPLRAFRDGVLSRSALGRRIIELYHDHAAGIRQALERSPALRAAARIVCEAAALPEADPR